MSHFPMYSNVSRWVFSGGKDGAHERGDPDNESGYYNHPLQHNARHSQRQFKAERIYVPSTSQQQFHGNPYTYNSQVPHAFESVHQFRDTATDGAVLHRKFKGDYESVSTYEKLTHSPLHHHEYLQGHNMHLASHDMHVACFKNHKEHGDIPSRSNKKLQMYQKIGLQDELAVKTDSRQYSDSKRHASYLNYMMEVDADECKDRKDVAAGESPIKPLEKSESIKHLPEHGDSVRHNFLQRKENITQHQRNNSFVQDDNVLTTFKGHQKKVEVDKEEEDDDEVISDSSFCSDFDEAIKPDYENDRFYADLQEKKLKPDYENEQFHTDLLEKFKLDHKKEKDHSSLQEEIKPDYQNDKFLTALQEEIKPDYQNDKFLTALQDKIKPDYENENFDPDFKLGYIKPDYENDEFHANLEDKVKPDYHDESVQTGLEKEILKPDYDVREKDNQTNAHENNHDDGNVYSLLDDHHAHVSVGHENVYVNNIYTDSSASGYLVPLEKRSKDKKNTKASPKNKKKDKTKVEKRPSNICRSLSSINSPLYENYSHENSSPVPTAGVTADMQILSSNLSPNVHSNKSSPDELFYAVSPTRTTTDLLYDSHLNNLLQNSGQNDIHSTNIQQWQSVLEQNITQSVNTQNLQSDYCNQPALFSSDLNFSMPGAFSLYKPTAIPNMCSDQQVFMKEVFEHHLDMEARKIHLKAALYIQKFARMFLARRKFLLIHKKTVEIQAGIRMHLARKRFNVIQHGIIQAQAQFRMYRERKKYLKTREEIKRKQEHEQREKQRENERIKMERERREKIMKAEASILNLEIPGELAYVYNKLDGWKAPHSDRQIISVIGDVIPMDMNYRLPGDINSHAFSKYTGVYFKNPDWGVSVEPIKSALTKVQGDQNNRLAQSVFKLILKYMYDHNLGDRQEKAMADYIVQLGLQNEGLRDEIYCQIANQTWNNQRVNTAERVWQLMAHTLSAFPPSPTLYKYLLKYVSDVGLDGYKWFCQHKALQCANIEPQLSRVYPPCLLEWRAAQRKANMALEVRFADNATMIGHVESWTSGEEFAKHLLNQRGLRENNMGWTVVLQEDMDYYELMGYDYVLDLISEMEIPPGFPVCRSHFLVSSDRTREPLSLQRNFYSESPHHPERERHMLMKGKLPEPMKIDITKIEQRSIKQRSINGERVGEEDQESGVEFSMTSVLNERPHGVSVDGLSDNKLNLRYTKRKAAPSPPIANGHLIANGYVVNGDISENGHDLSQTHLNRRYNNGVNGDDMSNTKLNQRYLRMTKVSGRQGAADKIARKTQREDRNVGSMDNVSVATGHSDWSHWVEDVFSNALNEHVDGLSDARSVENRLKGGGKGGGDGVPGPQFQSGPGGMQNGGITIPIQQMPVNGGLPNMVPSPLNLSASSIAPPLTPQQVAAQQQAMFQAYAQAQAQQRQQALLQAAFQQQQQQQQHQQQNQQQFAALQQQQQLQQMLQQQQMLQAAIQQQLQQPASQQLVSPNASFNSPQASAVGFFAGGSTQPTFTSESQQSRMVAPVPVSAVSRELPITVQGSQQELDSSGAKRVFKFKHHYEKETVNANQGEAVAHRQVSPPPPPPIQFADQTPRMAPAPPAPPPPPPPPVIDADSFDHDKGTFTFRDRKGRARTVRIGRVIWPPPQDKEEKKVRDVGRLEIDEKVQRELDERMRPTNAINKPESPKPAKKVNEHKKKQLAETVHLATLQLLEQKLGGAPEPPKAITPPPPPKVEPPPPPPPSMPPPKMPPLKTHHIKMERVKAEPVKVEHTTQTTTTVITSTEEPLPPEPEVIDYRSLELVITDLYRQNKDTYLMYHNVPWTVHCRKEVFMPGERLDNPLALHLVFCQVVQDVYNSGCIRINKDERIKMRGMLESHGINAGNYLTGTFKPQVKRIIVDTAKEWPTYFCRLFPVASSGHLAGIHYVGVSHSGIYLVQRVKSLVEDYLDVIEHIKFEDVVDIVMPSRTSIQISTKNKPYVFYTNRAQQLKDMLDLYLNETDRSNRYVVAMKDYITRESTLLSFKRGDVIKLMDADVDEGWLYGISNGVYGYFPAEMVKPLARHEVDYARREAIERTPSFRSQQQPTAHLSETTVQKVIHKSHNTSREDSREMARDGAILRDALPAPDNRSETSQGTMVPDGKFSMMEFALLHFRESVDKKEIIRKKGSGDWTWKEQAEMVKWTRSPIQSSLLKLDNPELHKLALECFICIMKFMGDYPMSSNQTEMDCALKVLRACHKYPELRDEVYCQLCKQTTNNRSMKPKSCIMGWRLFAIIAAYCDCSEGFRPYLFKYLETVASDTQRTYSGAAAICLQNLRKTFKYGGRKNVPLKEEINALANGRISKRFSFIYSGSEREGMLHIKPCTVVRDCTDDICQRLDVVDQVEVEEYTVFLRTRDGQFSRLRNEEYILDVTAELLRSRRDYDLVFQRTVWYFPVRVSDNLLYNELMYFQCLPDYLDGLLVMTRDGALNKQYEMDIQFLAALLHRASDHVNMPTLRDLEHLLPEIVRVLPSYKSQHWLNRIHDEMKTVIKHTPPECMAKFIEVLAQWPLFGSTFFRVKKVLTQPMYGECILAVNKTGIVFLDIRSHEIFLQYSFGEVLSTRRYRSDSNQNYLDMKLGNLMVQKIVRIETEQGSDISNLIGQYMQVINRHRKRPVERGVVSAPYQTPREQSY